MILAIDIGNTNICVGCVDDTKVYFTERFSTNREKTELEYTLDLKNLFELYHIVPTQIKGSIISSVVPPLSHTMQIAVQKILGSAPMLVGPGVKNGLKIRIDNPAQLGSDLVVDAVAAIHEYPLPAIIIDMGTATTFSIVDEDKQYLGSVICPGVQITLDTLTTRTSQLPRISLDSPKHAIGTNTIDAMKSGIILGCAAMLDGMIERINAELKTPATVIATGGLAASIIPNCRQKIIYDNDLLLKGLYLIYAKNI